MATYDVIIIGAGPGGYVCAIRCAQLGLKTAVVEGRETLGGTCLNVGCIPSKALLHASHMLHEAEHNFGEMGIEVGKPKVEWEKMLAFKDSVIAANTKGVEFLFKKNKITWLKGWASVPAAGKVKVGDEMHDAKHIIIASGSQSASIPGAEVTIDEQIVVTSTGALALPGIPGKLVVVGGGVIGLELGSVYSRLGSEVTVIEFMDGIIPGSDAEIARTFERLLKRQGLKIVTGAAVSKVETLMDGAKVTYRLRKDESEHQVDADIVLVATGRLPYTEGLGLDALGVTLTKRGQIAVDAHYRTNVPGIYAIGDVIEGPMLAHKAEDEGGALAEMIAGQKPHIDYTLIPGVIYTTPEVASVGATEEKLKEAGRAYKVGKFNFMANGRAKAMMQADGFVKILADKETDRILGAHILGPNAGEMIHEICVAMEFGAAAEDLARTCHAHPTTSEAVREAAMACGEGAIHA